MTKYLCSYCSVEIGTVIVLLRTIPAPQMEFLNNLIIPVGGSVCPVNGVKCCFKYRLKI